MEIKEFEDFGIEIERSAEFFDIAQQLSGFVRDLPLDTATNDRLVALMVKQVTAAEKGGFCHGFRMGMEYSKWEQGKKIASSEVLKQ